MTRYVAEAYWNYDGVKGDSSKQEVRICKYWNYASCGSVSIWRYNNKTATTQAKIRNGIIKTAIDLCNNEAIGYSMPNRLTGWKAIKKYGWSLLSPKKVTTKDKAEVDCSMLVPISINCAFGSEKMPSSNWTGTEAENLKKAGFTKVTSGYTLSTGEGLKPGDIILAHNGYAGTGHTGVYIGTKKTGSLYSTTTTTTAKTTTATKTTATTAEKYQVTADVLNIRSGAGTSYKIVGTVKKGEIYTIVEKKNNFGKLKSGAGWVSLSYLKKTK